MSRPPETAPLVEGVQPVRTLRVTASGSTAVDDRLVVEAPLEILLHHATLGTEGASFGTTLRTPGRDEDLAQAEAVLGVAHRRSHRTLTRPVAATTTVRVPLRVGFVTV